VERLRQLAAEFLRDKRFHGAHGFIITDEVALAVSGAGRTAVLHLKVDSTGMTIS
jgi:Mlc titration factor MtfA (ptsG expression regulator)